MRPALTLALLLVAGSASAQTLIAPAPLRPNQRPTLSPFLGLNESRAATGAFTLFRNVRPRQELLRQTRQQNRELRELNTALRRAETQRFDIEERLEQAAISSQAAVVTRGTGHSTAFDNTGNYYPARARRR